MNRWSQLTLTRRDLPNRHLASGSGAHHRPTAPQPRTSHRLRDMPQPLTAEELAYLQSLLDLARNGRAAELAAAVDAGIPVNLAGGTGDTFLILAAYHCHLSTVQALIARGADTERVNDRGQTALGAAVFRNSTDIVRALLAAGAQPTAGGRSALQIAKFFDLPDMTTLLRNETHVVQQP